MSADPAVQGRRTLSAAVVGESQTVARAWVRDRTVLVAMAGAALAGGIHLAVVREHLAEGLLIGGFFLALGLAQLGLVVALTRRLSEHALLGVIGAHLAVIALYAATRTVELPFVPPHDPGHSVDHLPVAGGVGSGIPIYPGSRIESVGVLDVFCLFAELAMVAAVVSMVSPRLRGRVTTLMACIAALGLLGRVLMLTFA